jgi:hypothetical protein
MFLCASRNQSPNHLLKNGVRTHTHCRSVSLVSLPFGAFIHPGFLLPSGFVHCATTAAYCRLASNSVVK